MQAIILAAGMGKRLKELTAQNTKCMVPVNGVTLIERALRILDHKNLSKIIIVVGYEGRKLTEFIATLSIQTPIVFVDNPIYEKTNNIYSLALAKEHLCAEDTLLLESDLIFEESVIDLLLEDSRETLVLVDKFKSWMDGTCMVLDEEDCITDFIPGKNLSYRDKEKYYKTVNIYKFSSHFSANTYVPFLEAYAKAMGNNEYYESVIKLIAMLETHEIRAKRLEGQIWYEIDDIQDLDIAQTLFPASEEEQYDAIAGRFGGYWRYPNLLDFCYLVNPYYPSEKMKEEMKSNFDTLLTQYPSGMRVNSLLAAKYFGVLQSQIVMGNGAAELISNLMGTIEGKIGFIRPTFEEYAHRVDEDRRVVYYAKAPDYRYSANDLMTYFDSKDIEALVVINPDNPSGNYLSYDEVIQLADWCGKKQIKLIYDESFADFAGEERHSLLNPDVLEDYADSLIVVKSISKSHGVPGVRLGVLASGDSTLIAGLKKVASIWNINSFGEYYMQIAEKYRKDFDAGLNKFACERERFYAELNDISCLRVLPSEANFFMVEVLDGISSKAICSDLLKNGIFVKDLTPKMQSEKQYIRVAVRNREDNNKILCELRKKY